MDDSDLEAQLSKADPAAGLALAEAAQAARRAWRMAQERNESQAAGRAAAWLCGHLFRLGQFDGLREVAAAALAALEAPALANERFEALRILAIADCEQGRFEQAFAGAHQLAQLAAQTQDAGQALMAAYVLGACFDRIGDPWQSWRVLQAAMAQHGDRATQRQQLIAHIGLCAFMGDAFHRMRDAAPASDRQEALQRSRGAAEQALRLLGDSQEPLMQVAVWGNLAELLLQQGEHAAAGQWLQRCIARADEAGLLPHRWRAEVTRADWLLAAGQAEPARAAMVALIAEAGDRLQPATAIRAHDSAHRACRALGQFEQALVHFSTFERLERARTLREIRAHSTLFVSRTEWSVVQSAAEAAQQEVVRQVQRAETDPLTGLGNRSLLERRGMELLDAARTQGTPLALAVIDIDHFKRVNDEHGHAAGDAVLVAIAQMLRDGTRGGDVLARVGGEEFVVLLPDTPQARANEVCERLRKSVRERQAWPGLQQARVVTLSVGLASWAGESLDGLMQRADDALYDAKRGGRDRLSVAGAR